MATPSAKGISSNIAISHGKHGRKFDLPVGIILPGLPELPWGTEEER